MTDLELLWSVVEHILLARGAWPGLAVKRRTTGGVGFELGRPVNQRFFDPRFLAEL